jgi:hypothetical protein
MVFPASAQDRNSGRSETFAPSHHVGLTIGHEHAFSGRSEDNKKEVLILPFWGVDYDFHFAPKFRIGFHTDFIIESFKVEKNLDSGPEEIVARTRPIAPALMASYKPTEHWSFSLGMGGESSKEESYVLNRLAVEYGAEIRKGWEIAGSFQYDVRWDAYDTWTIGLGISKSFGTRPN